MRAAFKTLGKNKLRSFLMMIGIVIGIAATTSIISAGLGAQKRVMDRVEKFGLQSLMVFAGAGREIGHPLGGQGITTLTLEDANAIQTAIPQVRAIAPFNRRQSGMVKYQEISITTRIFGVTPTWDEVWDWNVHRGEFINEEDEIRFNRICTIGPTVAKSLFGNDDPIGKQILIGALPFQVKGVMEEKGVSPAGGDMDDRIFIPLSTFLRRVANVDYVSGIKILLKDGSSINEAVTRIQSLLRDRHHLTQGEPDDFTVTSATEVTRVAERVAGTFNMFLIIVAAISLIAGGFVIANIMLISVNERCPEIGLRKAIGAKANDILLQFLLESLVVTIIGGIAGIILGFFAVKIFAEFFQFPIAISWAGAMIGIIVSGLVGLASGLYPARRASAMQPVEALRM